MTISKYVYRVSHGVGAHHLLSLFFAVSTVTVIIGCTSTTLSTPDQTPGPKCQVTATGPQTAITGIGGSGTIAVNAAPECAWSASTEATWITDISPSTGQGAAGIQFKAAPNPERVPRQGDIAVSGVLVHINQEPAPCSFEVKPQNLSIGFSGGSDSVTVTAAAGCAWSALSQANWITVTSAKENTGSGTVTIEVAAQPDATARTGLITVAGQAITVSQGGRNCTSSINPSNLSIGFTGGSGSVTVTTAAGCAWSAISQANWITITSAKENTGSGTVTIDVAAQPDSTTRTGLITVAGQTVTVSQAGRNCSYSINPSSANFATAGGTGSVTVTAPGGCTWTATTNAAWIAVTTGANGNGSGSVAYSVGANAGAARTGVLLIGAQSFTINQASAPCSFGIGPTSQDVTRASGTGATVAVTTQSFCSWTAASNDSWITVLPPASGTGNGNVSWTYSANQVTAPRSGTMTIAGQTFTVTQEAGCAYVIGPTSQNVGRTAGTGTTVAITTQASCSWTAMSNASWITVNTASGSGNGNVGWTYAENTVPATRTGTMTIAGQTFTVTQDPGCSYVISPTSQSVRDAAGTGTTVTVTTQSSCAWTAVSNASWITVTSPGSGSGNGNVGWTYAANTGTARSGTMTIGGQTFTVDQAAPCTYSVSPVGQTISALGGAGTPVTVTTQAGCFWTAVSNDSWITVTSGATGTGNGTVQINVGANVVFAGRAGTLLIGGQYATVIQDGVVSKVARAEDPKWSERRPPDRGHRRFDRSEILLESDSDVHEGAVEGRDLNEIPHTVGTMHKLR